MLIEVVHEFERFASLTSEWNELLGASASDCPFLTAEWLQAWWTRLADGRSLHLVLAREGGRLMAAAPLLAEAGPLGMFPRLAFLGTGNAGSDYLDVIVRCGHERDGLQAIASTLTRGGRSLRLDHVADASLALSLAERLTSTGWTMRRSAANVCPIVLLAGHTWETYLASLGASHRANVRRRTRALASAFPVRFDRVTSEDERRRALDTLVELHLARFGHTGSTAFLSPELCAFHHEATRRALKGGWLRMFVLRLDEVPAAVMYGFAYNRRFYFYQHGFDPRFESFSVGLVLMGQTIRAALDEGMLEFDMLYGAESYKRLWARVERPLMRLHLYPPHIGGLVNRRTEEAERTVRAVARRILTMGAARAS